MNGKKLINIYYYDEEANCDQMIEQHNLFVTGGTTLLSVLKYRICLLLKEKEETVMIPEHAAQWLSREVASIEAINTAGTFR